MDNKRRWCWTPCQIFFSFFAIILTFISFSLGLFHLSTLQPLLPISLINHGSDNTEKTDATITKINKFKKKVCVKLIKLDSKILAGEKETFANWRVTWSSRCGEGKGASVTLRGLTPECESVKWSAGTTRPSPEVTGERTKSTALARPPPSQI